MTDDYYISDEGVVIFKKGAEATKLSDPLVRYILTHQKEHRRIEWRIHMIHWSLISVVIYLLIMRLF